jgi:hypothetical protein
MEYTKVKVEQSLGIKIVLFAIINNEVPLKLALLGILVIVHFPKISVI